jgi:hypothetical protein
MRKKWGFSRPSPALIISILALFVALGGVGAYAAGALTTKKAKKIAKNQVLTLAPTLSVAKAANATNADKAKDADTLGGASLGSLTVGRSNNGPGCNLAAASATFVNCGTVDLPLPRSGRVLVNAGGSWRAQAAAPTEGGCQIAVDGAVQSGTLTRYGQSTNTFDAANRRASVSINFVSGVLGAGTHALQLQCNDPVGDVFFDDNQVSAVMIGTG